MRTSSLHFSLLHGGEGFAPECALRQITLFTIWSMILALYCESEVSFVSLEPGVRMNGPGLCRPRWRESSGWREPVPRARIAYA